MPSVDGYGRRSAFAPRAARSGRLYCSGARVAAGVEIGAPGRSRRVPACGPGGDLFAALVPAGVPPEDNELGWRESLDRLAALLEGDQRSTRTSPAGSPSHHREYRR